MGPKGRAGILAAKASKDAGEPGDTAQPADGVARLPGDDHSPDRHEGAQGQRRAPGGGEAGRRLELQQDSQRPGAPTPTRPLERPCEPSRTARSAMRDRCHLVSPPATWRHPQQRPLVSHPRPSSVQRATLLPAAPCSSTTVPRSLRAPQHGQVVEHPERCTQPGTNHRPTVKSPQIRTPSHHRPWPAGAAAPSPGGGRRASGETPAPLRDLGVGGASVGPPGRRPLPERARRARPAGSTVEPRCGSDLAVPARLVGRSEPGNQAKGGDTS
jgi:hypothetical protein